MVYALKVVPSTGRRCMGCPADQDHTFESMVGIGKGECEFHGTTLEARAALPERWFAPGGAALIRRGLVMRVRTDAQGRHHGVDLAGAGHLLPLDAPQGAVTHPSGYAVSHAHLCLASAGAFERAIFGAGERAADVSDLVRLQFAALRRVERYSEARGRPSIEARVGALLVALLDELQLEAEVPADLQQRDLALLLGIRHESVCRALAALEKRGLIERGGLGTRVMDRQALDAL